MTSRSVLRTRLAVILAEHDTREAQVDAIAAHIDGHYHERIRAALRLCFPEDMTPAAKAVFERILKDMEKNL